MPVERRSLRSSKDTSSTNNTSKEKPSHSRTTSKSKAAPAKKSSSEQPTNGISEAKAVVNGAEPTQNGINGTQDVEMNGENGSGDQMTVVVPPPRDSKTPGQPEKDEDAMDVGEDGADQVNASQKTYESLFQDIKTNLEMLDRAVNDFDNRFTLRTLRTIPTIRKLLDAELLSYICRQIYPSQHPSMKIILQGLGEQTEHHSSRYASISEILDKWIKQKDPSPEIDSYLLILTQVVLYDQKAFEAGAQFSSGVVQRLRSLNRRTLDSLAAKAYYYYSLFYEHLTPAPPSPTAPLLSIRPTLLAALRTSVLRKDQDTQATVTNLLLRNYLLASHVTQADLLIARTQFPPAASNNQIARYLYYLGRIRAIQLSYTDAHESLTGAVRKSPSTPSAGGFFQASNKLLVVVELLMGDIPDRAIFRQPSLEEAMRPYLELVQAVRVGKIENFQAVVETNKSVFQKDNTLTLIHRLRQNVIKTGIRMMSLSYSKISLRDICIKLDLESEESAEYIVAKAIRDGVIDAVLDHERGFMRSKETGDIYATNQPGNAFHERIRACLDLHDESVKAMRFPMNQHRLELKNAQEARERERELAKDIIEGDLDEDDAGGDLEGM